MRLTSLSWPKTEKRTFFVKYIVFAAIIILSIYIGNSIAEAGKIRARVLALFLPLLFIWVFNLSNAGRFRLLIVAVLLVPLQTPKIPFQLSVSELLLFMLACLYVPAFQLKKKRNNALKVNFRVFSYRCLIPRRLPAGSFIHEYD